MAVSLAQAQVFFLALTRILAIIIHVPVLGGRSIPDTVKLGLGVFLAMLMIPWQPLPADATPLTSLAFGAGVFRELLIGTLAGFAAILTFNVLQIAGHLMDQGTGFGSSQIFNPALEVSGGAIDQIFSLTGLVIFLVINGHLTFLMALQKSFVLIPVNSPLPDLSIERLVSLTGSLIATGIQMALPIMLTLLLADITLGLLARVAPQVQVYFLGLPLKIAGGLFIFAATLSILLPNLIQLFQSLGPRMLELLGA